MSQDTSFAGKVIFKIFIKQIRKSAVLLLLTFHHNKNQRQYNKQNSGYCGNPVEDSFITLAFFLAEQLLRSSSDRS